MQLHTKRVWLPGAASCLLFFGLHFLLGQMPIHTTFISPEQKFLFIFWPYLAVMPFAGGFGAYLSRRMKGTVIERILAASFPVLTFAALFAVRVVYGLFYEREPYTLPHFLSGLMVTLVFGIVGGLFLAFGAWPFCSNAKLSPSDSAQGDRRIRVHR